MNGKGVYKRILIKHKKQEENDRDYQQYLRLKEKFEGKNEV